MYINTQINHQRKSQPGSMTASIGSWTKVLITSALSGAIASLSVGVIEPSWSASQDNNSVGASLILSSQAAGNTTNSQTDNSLRSIPKDGIAQTSARDYWQQGVQKETSGDYEGSVADFTKAIQIDPNYAPAYDSRGIAHFRLGRNIELALADFSKAIEIDPENVNAYSNRCSAYRIIKMYKEAAGDCDRAVEIAPDFPNVYNSRGNLRIDMKQYQGAISDFTRAIELRSDIGQPYYNRGRAYRILRRNNEALADFRRAATLYRKAGNRPYYLDAVRAVRELEEMTTEGNQTEG